MADQVDVSATAEYTVSTDDAGAAGQVQRVKLAYSADGVATHVQADADGVLVNLGANNDVTVAGTVSVTGVATAANQTTVIGHLDGVEGLLTTIDADTGSLPGIATSVDGIEALLGTIDADTGTIATEVAGLLTDTELRASPVPVSGTVAVTGVATAANQTTVIGHLDGVEALLGTIDADTGGILTAVQLIDNAISGSEMQVDVVAALPAGTNNIGDVDIVTGPTVSTSTDISLASSASSAQLIAANASRKGMTLTNTDANTAYIYYGTTASATKFTVKIPTDHYWEMPSPIFTGRIDAIWAGDGSGALIGSEL